jgi:hypothetical protein
MLPRCCSSVARKGVFYQRTAGVLVGTKEFDVLVSEHACEEAPRVGNLFESASDRHQFIVAATNMGLERCSTDNGSAP